MPDFGIDIAAVSDLDRGLRLVSGNRTLGEALARRLQTPRGALFYDENYGIDVRELANDAPTDVLLARWRARVEAELEKDARVLRCRATLTASSDGTAVTIACAIVTADGPFDLVLEVSAVSVTVLST